MRVSGATDEVHRPPVGRDVDGEARREVSDDAQYSKLRAWVELACQYHERNDDGDRGDHELRRRRGLSNDPGKPRSHRRGHCLEVRLEAVIARHLHHLARRARGRHPEPIARALDD